MRTLTFPMAAVAALVVLRAASAQTNPAVCGETFSAWVQDDPKRPLTLALSAKSASLKTGVQLRVEIVNRGTAPCSLTVCPAMRLCCVKDLHVLVGHDGTGMGLIDVCRQAQPASHEVFLLPEASFSFNLTLPTEWLPADCRKAGQTLQVKLCYAPGEGSLVHSPAVPVVLGD